MTDIPFGRTSTIEFEIAAFPRERNMSMDCDMRCRRRAWKPFSLAFLVLGVSTTAFADELPALMLPWDQIEEPAAEASSDELMHPAFPGVGEIEIVRERYPNGNVKIERGVTWDADGNYVNHGPWTMLGPTGAVVAEGKFDMGRRVGTWRRFVAQNDAKILNTHPFNRFQAPFVSQVNFNDGTMDGEWLVFDANGKKCLQISIEKGKRHGPAIVWIPSGQVFRQATYEQGVPVGDVMEISTKSGELERAASYLDGREVVTDVQYHNRSRQRKTEAMYLAPKTVVKTPDNFWTLELAEYAPEGESMMHGPLTGWFEDGRQSEKGYYQHGKKAGTFTYWYPNGQIAVTGDYKNDRPDGMWVWYHENGLKSTVGNFVEGKLRGEWRWWGEDGQLLGQKTYDGTEGVAAGPELKFLEVGQRGMEKEFVR